MLSDALDAIGYMISGVIRFLIPAGQLKHEKYADYVERRREKGPVKGFGFLFVTGSVFMAAALVFIALFYSVY